MKKKLIALFLCSVMVIGLTGCETLLKRRDDAGGGATTATEGETTEVAAADATTAAPGTDDSDIDPSLVPILPEISEAAVTAEPMEDDGRLNIVFFGDSQFENGVDTHNSIPDLVGMHTHAHIYNMGMGGTCAALTSTDGNDPDNWDNRSFVGLAGMMKGTISRAVLEGRPQQAIMEAIDPAQVDYYVISYGLNDFRNGIRSHKDDERTEIHNYYGALNSGINDLEEISPKAQFILCTPCYTQFYNDKGHYIGDSHIHDFGIGTLDDYAVQVTHLARDSYLVLDAAFDSMFNLNGNNAAAYLMDGVHLTDRGREVYALALTYLIAKDQGWTDKNIDKIDIDHIDWSTEFLSDIPAVQ